MAYPKGRRYNTRTNQAPVVRAARLVRNWSSLQRAIFEEIAHGSGNLHVDALAGTGKTSTIVEGFYYVPAGLQCLMVAFNKSISTELGTKAPPSVTVSTLHALGLRAITKAFGRVVVDTEKLRGYVQAELGSESETFELRKAVEQGVSLAKGYLADTPEAIVEALSRHDVDSGEMAEAEFVALIQKLMHVTKMDTARVDFDDMIWFPACHNLSPVKYDMVFIDEAQDLNLAQIDLALRSRKSNGRVVSVGDQHQAIYGFRGASTDAIQNIVDAMSSKRLPLSVTYRCGKAIVAEAQAYVENYEAAPGNSDGRVETVSQAYMVENARAGDFILSRVNAPLISLCLGFLKEGRKANIQGRDLGNNLLWMIKKSKAVDVMSFLEWLQNWRDAEVAKYTRLNREKSVEIVCDKAECLMALCDGCTDIKEVKDNIARLFKDGDDKDRIMLSSTHKAKGLERERVWMLRSTYRPQQGGEEANLAYVAITRAINELYYVK
jgi:superfamily I DNA/RNA helicase